MSIGSSRNDFSKILIKIQIRNTKMSVIFQAFCCAGCRLKVRKNKMCDEELCRFYLLIPMWCDCKLVIFKLLPKIYIFNISMKLSSGECHKISLMISPQLALRRWPNVGIGRHRRDRQPTSRQRWYSVACVATVCWHSVGARRLAYRSLPMLCVWTSVVGIKCFSNKCCRSTRLSIHQLHI